MRFGDEPSSVSSMVGMSEGGMERTVLLYCVEGCVGTGPARVGCRWRPAEDPNQHARVCLPPTLWDLEHNEHQLSVDATAVGFSTSAQSNVFETISVVLGTPPSSTPMSSGVVFVCIEPWKLEQLGPPLPGIQRMGHGMTLELSLDNAVTNSSVRCSAIRRRFEVSRSDEDSRAVRMQAEHLRRRSHLDERFERPLAVRCSSRRARAMQIAGVQRRPTEARDTWAAWGWSPRKPGTIRRANCAPRTLGVRRVGQPDGTRSLNSPPLAGGFSQL